MHLISYNEVCYSIKSFIIYFCIIDHSILYLSNKHSFHSLYVNLLISKIFYNKNLNSYTNKS